MKRTFLQIGLVAALGTSMVLGTSCRKADGTPPPPQEDVLKTDTTSANGVTTVKLTTPGTAGTGNITLEKKYEYILDGKVYVNDGETLTIEAGTIVKGGAGSGEAASALVVARGGMLMAEGTAADPIIFTSQADGIYRNGDGDIVEGNLGATNKGLWGGVVILGNAGLTGNQVKSIEGLPEDDDRSKYGNESPVNNESSGVIKYISIRHGGAQVAADNEINGLTLGGVGSGTEIDYVEVYANFDDGIEWFGGTVDVKHAVVAYSGDDSFDYDQGYRGNGQFWLAVQDADSDRGGEFDGGPKDCEDCDPIAMPTLNNITFVGNGDSRAMTFRDNAAGKLTNALFVNFGKGIDVEDLASGEDSYARLKAGNLKLDNITFETVTKDFTVRLDYADSETAKDISGESSVTNITTSGVTTGVSASDPVPSAKVAGASISAGDFFDATDYQGAFEVGSNWAEGWTKTYAK